MRGDVDSPRVVHRLVLRITKVEAPAAAQAHFELYSDFTSLELA